MKKKHLKAQIQSLNRTIAVLEKKYTCLELIVKWQNERLDSKREEKIKQKAKDFLDKG